MNTSKKLYRYVVECVKRGQWVPVCHTDHEDKSTFELVANAVEYQYRILCDGTDVTDTYKKGGFIHAGKHQSSN